MNPSRTSTRSEQDHRMRSGKWSLVLSIVVPLALLFALAFSPGPAAVTAEAAGNDPPSEDKEIPQQLAPGFGRRARQLFDEASAPPSESLPEIFPIKEKDSFTLVNLPLGRTRRRATAFDHQSVRKTLLDARKAEKARLTLFPDTKLVITIGSVREAEGRLFLEATTDSQMIGLVRLVVLPEGGGGFVQVDGRVFDLHPFLDAMMVIDEIEQGRFQRRCVPRPAPVPPPPRPPTLPPPPEVGVPGAKALAMDPPSAITVLILVANQPERKENGFDTPGGQAFWAEDFRSMMDMVFATTGTTVASSVLVENVAYVPPGDPYLNSELNWVYWDPGVDALRNARKADVVFLLVWNTSAQVGGITYQNECLEAWYGVGVVEYSAIKANYILSHELGHVMGMDHDRILSPEKNPVVCGTSGTHKSAYVDPPPCNCGWVIWDGTNVIRTIMASPQFCMYVSPEHCIVLPLYSFPPLFGTDCPAPGSGATWGANNRAQLLFAAPWVAAFR